MSDALLGAGERQDPDIRPEQAQNLYTYIDIYFFLWYCKYMPEATPQPTPINPPIEERHTSFFSQHKFTIISIAILVVALIPLIVLTQMQKKQTSSSPVSTITQTSPTPALTQDNAQPTLDQHMQNIQDALDNSQTDLNTVSKIDASADSTSGL